MVTLSGGLSGHACGELIRSRSDRFGGVLTVGKADLLAPTVLGVLIAGCFGQARESGTRATGRARPRRPSPLSDDSASVPPKWTNIKK